MTLGEQTAEPPGVSRQDQLAGTGRAGQLHAERQAPQLPVHVHVQDVKPEDVTAVRDLEEAGVPKHLLALFLRHHALYGERHEHLPLADEAEARFAAQASTEVRATELRAAGLLAGRAGFAAP